MTELWDEVNDVEYDVQDVLIYSTIHDKLKRILNEIGESHPEYLDVNVLEKTFSLAVNLDDHVEPYTFQLLIKENRSIGLQDFSEDMVNTLKKIIDENILRSSLMLFRVMDVYWTLRKDYLIRGKLFSNLMLSIDSCFSQEKYHLTKDLLERGFQLFGSEPKKRNELIEKLDSIIETYNLTLQLDPSIKIFIYGLLDLAHKYHYIKGEKYPKIGVGIAEIFERNNDFDSAIHWWKLCTKWYFKLKRDDCAFNCKKNEALNYYALAKKELAKEKINYFVVVHNINCAILSMRKVKGNEELVQNWSIEKKEYEKNTLGQFSYIESPGIDISKTLEEIEIDLTGKNLYQIIYYITNLVNSIDYQKVLDESSNNKGLVELIPNQIVNEEGKTIYISENDNKFPNYVINVYRARYEYSAALIQHSIELLYNQHFSRIEYLLEITEQNIFIPENRKFIFARGLFEGLKANYVSSLSILIPQFENSIRFLLEQHGENVTNLGEDSVQEEQTLNKLLSNDKLVEILGLNVVKDLQHLFVNKGGENLRNKLSHGLLSLGGFNSPAAIYAFGIILKIVLFFKLEYIS
ncbi:DUF4209 domain-containing protein [Bacillus pseudomycoides]